MEGEKNMANQFSNYINRELSWLEFNQRVLDQAFDRQTPLLERLKFLSITGSNLDEFFMVRVGGLRMLETEGVGKEGIAGLPPKRQLALVETRVRKMVADQDKVFLQQLDPKLTRGGIRRLSPPKMDERSHSLLERKFDSEIAPVITPVAVETGRRNPLLRNLELHVAVRLKPREQRLQPRYAVIPLGMSVNRFVHIPDEKQYSYALVEDVVGMFAARLFPDEEIAEIAPFRITRNADLEVREDSAADLLAAMENVLDARKYGNCIRLEVAKGTSRTLVRFFQQILGVGDTHTYEPAAPLRISDFMQLTSLGDHKKLVNEPWIPQPTIGLDAKTDMFALMGQRNILLYHPYESFEPVVRFVEQAAADPGVLAIKQILYRTSKNSPIISALKRAAQKGKYVTVLVELKARFDEARNIEWARELEQEGVQVVYGVKNLKTHAKTCIVVRKEKQGIVRYVHFGTGNYNESTARLYTDISYMTSEPVLGADASAFFNAITGFSQPRHYRHIASAPTSLRERIVEHIQSETERRRHGHKALIMMKVNSLADKEVIDALYEASKAGVKVLLNVRGICCLRPGVPGLSENIRVLSIVDRFLEHARLFYFFCGGMEKTYIASADMMPRNLDKRVELLVPVDDPSAAKRLKEILELHQKDTARGKVLQPDGTWIPAGTGIAIKNRVRSQELLYRSACEKVDAEKQRRKTVFEPHRPEGADH